MKKTLSFIVALTLLALPASALATSAAQTCDGSGTLPSGGNWTAQRNNVTRSANNCRGATSGDFNNDYYSGATWANDQMSSTRIGGTLVSSTFDSVYIMVRNSGALSSELFYDLGLRGLTAGHLSMVIYKHTAASGNFDNAADRIGTSTDSTTYAFNDVFSLKVVGTTLTAYKNGVQVGPSFTDSTVTSGSPGFGMFSTSAGNGQNAWAGTDDFSTVNFDNIATTTDNTSVSSTTFTSPTTTGSNTLGLVCVAQDRNTNDPTVTGVTWNGSAMTQLNQNSTGFAIRTSLWQIVNPTSASSIVVSYSAAAAQNRVLTAAVYDGVDQTTPTRTATSFASTTGSVLKFTNTYVNAQAGDQVASCAGIEGGTVSGAATSTDMFLRGNKVNGAVSSGFGDEGGNSSLRFTWEWTGPSASERVEAVGMVPAPISTINLDVASSSLATFVTAGGAVNLTLDAGTAANRLLLVHVNWSASNAATVSGITYNGVSLTSQGAAVAQGNNKDQLFVLAGPASGSNTLAITSSAAAGNSAAMVTTYVYDGVDQTTPTDGYVTAKGSDASAPLTSAVTVTSQAGDRAVVFHGIDNSGTADPTNYIEHTARSGTSGSTESGDSNGAPSIATTGTWTDGAGAINWTAIGINMNPASATPPASVVFGPQVILSQGALILLSGQLILGH